MFIENLLYFLMNTTTLVVKRANPSQKHTGFARLSFDIMDKIGIVTGDTIGILGKCMTVARCKPHFAWEKYQNSIRIDSITRKNAGVKIGESVSVKKIKVSNAHKVNVIPLNNIPKGSEQYLHDFLEGHVIARGDLVSLPYFDKTLDYRIRKIESQMDYALVTRETVFHIDIV